MSLLPMPRLSPALAVLLLPIALLACEAAPGGSDGAAGATEDVADSTGQDGSAKDAGASDSAGQDVADAGVLDSGPGIDGKTPPPEDSGALDSGALGPDVTEPLTVDLALSVQPALMEHALVATVKGALPGATVVLYASIDEGAAASCPTALAPACLGFGGELVVASAAAPNLDAVVMLVPLDAAALQGATTLLLQAGSWAGGDGFVSNVVTAPRLDNTVLEGQDTDGDGLDDVEELAFGSDPKKADTDGDGLDDGEEVALGTSPTKKDTDDDGLDDPVELKTTKTDPTKADTDQDLLSDGQEIELGYDPNDPDMDKDGLLDGQELLSLGTDPQNADSDGDGMTDGLELALGTDPTKTTLPPKGWDQPGIDSDGDGIPDWLDVEECDGLDNDGDGLTDEGFNGGDDDGDGVLDCLENEDCDCVDDDGDGKVAEHCVYNVQLTTASANYPHYVFLDGIAVPQGTYEHISLHPGLHGGAHTLAIQDYAQASGAKPHGIRARVLANGVQVIDTGDLGWVVQGQSPAADWKTNPQGAPALQFPASCVTWPGSPVLAAAGTTPITYALDPTTGCALDFTATGDSYKYTAVTFTLCGAIEACNGIDDDGDGFIDEGMSDMDGDGLCDQLDWEVCDGIDNDGDGVTDEGTPDNDGDGLCNVFDWEECDGIDNNGNGKIDEGIDLNQDGVSDCQQDYCQDTNQPMIAVLGNHEVRIVHPTAGTTQLLGTVPANIGDLAITPQGTIYALGANGGQMSLYRLTLTTPPQLTLLDSFGSTVNWPVHQGAVAYDGPDSLLVGWDTTIYRYTLSTQTLTPLWTEGWMEQIRDFSWYQGELYVVGWVYNGGPRVFRWDRCKNTMVTLLNTGNVRPCSLAVDPQGLAYLNMEITFNSNYGAETNMINAFDIPSLARTPLFRVANYPQYAYVDAAEFPGNTCQRVIEACDCRDNDLDGDTDEGFDTDGDGIPDCQLDPCNGVDDNSNGQIDEHGQDFDGDGICNELDIEVCDGIDNDGDGTVDDVDLNGDGVSDCGQDLCAQGDLLLVGGSPGQIRRLVPSTGWLSGPQTAAVKLADIAVAPDRGVYGIGRVGWSVKLFQLDPATGYTLERKNVSSYYGADNELGIAVDHNGLVYAAFGSTVVRWDPATGGATTIATLAAVHGNIRDLAFYQGALWALTNLKVMRLDVQTGAFVAQAAVSGDVRAIAAPFGGPLLLERQGGSQYQHDLGPLDPFSGAYTPSIALTGALQDEGLGALSEHCQAGYDACDGQDNDGDGQTDEGHPDTDGDGVADCVDVEGCDCLDNDGDGAVDEGCTYSLVTDASFDDFGAVVVDGGLQGFGIGWTHPTRFFTTVGPGAHRVAISVQDQGGPAKGVAGLITLDGQIVSKSGDGSWRSVPATPGWFNTTSTTLATHVLPAPWPQVPVLAGTGAAWVWNGAGAQATYTVDLFVCGAYGTKERCDGLDNDGNGVVDDGWPVGCAVAETVCDGIDADGDGYTDEGFPDTDLDGVADCVDEETCDGVDNDGDLEVDEGFDADGDGIADCFDVEECDDQDNDGDGLIDEGFDADGDGVPDCFDEEECDGVDNDGDGLVDEGWPDWNGDGVPDCTEPTPEECNCLDDDGDGLTDEDCTYTFALSVTGAGSYVASLDGQPLGSDSLWTTVEHYAATVTGGAHQLAVLVKNKALPKGGFIAVAWLNGQPMALTGDGQWRVGLPPLPAGWQTQALGWFPELVVQNVSYPGPAQLTGMGTQWVWTKDAAAPQKWPQNAYVLPFEVCGTLEWSTKEQCDGVDNTGEGLVDEGFPDTDGDGVADCVDQEGKCNGEDEDGDGVADDGWPDADMDGIADCVDVEECDGIDNDGDGAVDEGFPDKDGDGKADCPVEQEIKCNGLDDDKDGLVDEGWPDADGDGIADCVDPDVIDIPEKVCDCVDDDADGVVDDGCLYTVSIDLESLGAGTLWVAGGEAATGTGVWNHTLAGVGAEEDVDLGLWVMSDPTLGGGVRVMISASATAQKLDPFKIVTVASAPEWTAAGKAEPGWPLAPLSGPAEAATCELPLGGPLGDAPWLWRGECAPPNPAPQTYYHARYRVCAAQ